MTFDKKMNMISIKVEAQEDQFLQKMHEFPPHPGKRGKI